MIRNIFKNKFFSSETEPNSKDTNNGIINIIALLIEASSVDGIIEQSETEKILSLVSNYFDLDKQKINNYYKQAISIQKNNTSFHNLTSKIQNNYSYEEKIDILEMLWEVVLTDGVEHDYESNLMRRICGLFYIKDIDSGKAKKRVLEKFNK
tara:strand:+ start:417 stop:872 length:456 start_codon:yes stop_codon:yes gene_type:complete